MQGKNERAAAPKIRRESRFFLAMAKTGPYSGIVTHRKFFRCESVARRAPGDVR
jgi:hypothetical protein